MTAESPRERLLQAAREVVAEDGLEGLTLRSIARRAGVSHGAPLRHFPSLASLLAAVAAEGFGRLMAGVDDHLARAGAAAASSGRSLDARQRLAVAAQAYIDFAVTDPGVFSITFRPERVDLADEAYATQGFASFRQLVELVEDAQAEGWMPDHAADHLAAVLWSHVHGLAELTLHGALPGVVGDQSTASLTALSCSLVLGVDTPGVPPPPAPPRPPTDPPTDVPH